VEQVTRIELALSAWEAEGPDRRGMPLTSVFAGEKRFRVLGELPAEPRSRPLFADALGTPKILGSLQLGGQSSTPSHSMVTTPSSVWARPAAAAVV